MEYLKEIMAQEEVITLVLKLGAIIIGLVWSWMKTKGWLKDKKDAKILAIAERAAKEVYDEFVRSLKYGVEGKQDRKLTITQMKQARDKAWAKAVEIAKSEGLNYAKEVSAEYWPVLLDKVIGGLKNNA